MLMQAGFWDKPCPVTNRPNIVRGKTNFSKSNKNQLLGTELALNQRKKPTLGTDLEPLSP